MPSKDPLDPGTNEGDPEFDAIAGPEETRGQIGDSLTEHIRFAIGDPQPGPRDLLGGHPEPFTPGPVPPLPPEVPKYKEET